MLERWKRWRRKYWVIYYLDFLAIQLLLICRYWYKLDWQDESWLPVMADIAGVSAAAAVSITIIAEVLGRMVLLIPAAAREITRKARAEAKAEGAAETNRKWRAYLERKAAAERDGLPFDEPPPG